MTIAHAQALGLTLAHAAREMLVSGEEAYKNPKLRIAIKEARVRLFSFRFQTMGMGRTANVTSVMMFTTRWAY